MSEVVSPEVCDAKHDELLRAMEHIEKKLDKLFQRIDGNGAPGIMERLWKLEQLVEHLRAALNVAKSRAWELFTRILPWAVAAIAAAYGIEKHV